MLELIDTHCHIHEADPKNQDGLGAAWQRGGQVSAQSMIDEAAALGVNRMICVGTTLEDSQRAVEFAKSRPNVWASVGVHPHEAKEYVHDSEKLQKISKVMSGGGVVAIGECGLDYHYKHSNREDQRQLLRFHLQQAKKYDLNMIFHIREAFDDFWPVFDEFSGIQGVVHSFSSDQKDLEQILKRDLFVGVNGIATFTKDPSQREAYKQIPLNRLLLETDAPFLAPAPFRGKVCEPKHVRTTAEFLADLRGEDLEVLAKATTQNAVKLFGLDTSRDNI